MYNPGIPLQSAQNPPPDEDMLAMLGLHPQQMQLAHGLASGAIHPQQVLDAVTPKSGATDASGIPADIARPSETGAPPAISSPSGAVPSIAKSAGSIPPLIARPADQMEAQPSATAAPVASAPPPPSLTGMGASPRIAPALPANVTPPTRLSNDQGELERLQRTGSGLEQFQQRHPVLGTIARIGAGFGSALFPTIAAQIPGTDLHHQMLVDQERGAVNQDLTEQKDEGQIAETGARTAALQNPPSKTGLTPEETTIHDLMTGTNGQPRINPETNKPYTYLEAYSAVNQAKQDAKPTPGQTQEQNKLAYQAVIGKLDAAKLSTDPKAIDKSLDKALAQKVITPEEHAAARSYEAANPTPGTNLTVHLAGEQQANSDAINKMFEGKEVLAHMPDGRRVQMSYADAKAQGIPPERLVALNGKEAQDTRDKAASLQTTFKGLDRYRSDFKTEGPKLTADDRKAMEVLTSHVQTSPDFVGKIAGGVFDSLAGEPLTGYSEKFFDGLMTKDQYNTLSPAGKKMVSDYATAVIDNFANMKAIMGSVGRNPQMIQAEVATLPLPYLDLQSAMIQFENKRTSLQGRAASMPELYTPPSK